MCCSSKQAFWQLSWPSQASNNLHVDLSSLLEERAMPVSFFLSSWNEPFLAYIFFFALSLWQDLQAPCGAACQISALSPHVHLWGREADQRVPNMSEPLPFSFLFFFFFLLLKSSLGLQCNRVGPDCASVSLVRAFSCSSSSLDIFLTC